MNKQDQVLVIALKEDNIRLRRHIARKDYSIQILSGTILVLVMTVLVLLYLLFVTAKQW